LCPPGGTMVRYEVVPYDMVRYEVFSGKTAEKQPEMSIVKRVEGRGICQDPQRYAQ
jgi:hypothetical protein